MIHQFVWTMYRYFFNILCSLMMVKQIALGYTISQIQMLFQQFQIQVKVFTFSIITLAKIMTYHFDQQSTLDITMSQDQITKAKRLELLVQRAKLANQQDDNDFWAQIFALMNKGAAPVEDPCIGKLEAIPSEVKKEKIAPSQDEEKSSIKKKETIEQGKSIISSVHDDAFIGLKQFDVTSKQQNDSSGEGAKSQGMKKFKEGLEKLNISSFSGSEKAGKSDDSITKMIEEIEEISGNFQTVKEKKEKQEQ